MSTGVMEAPGAARSGLAQGPDVTVVMIFLNADRFIAEAIESVLAQTYASWELILVDDGSVDGSGGIAQRYAAKHPERVRYVEHPGHENRGMSASRNLGIQQSRGRYVAFLDADDVYLPEKLEQQVAALEANPTAAMVFSPDTEAWYSWTGLPEDLNRDVLRVYNGPYDTLVSPPALATLFLSGRAKSPATCGVLIRREMIDEVGGFENAFRGMFEDQAFFYKLCLRAPVFVMRGTLDRYRQHDDSECSRMQKTGFYDWKLPSPARHNFLSWLERYVQSQEVRDPKLLAWLDTALVPYRNPLRYRLTRGVEWIQEIPRLARSVPTRVRGASREMAGALSRLLPTGVRVRLHRVVGPPGVGRVQCGDLRRTTPIDRNWGWQRGAPVDRHYIEQFLTRHAGHIRGHVLEVGEDRYSSRLGGGRITRLDVLHVDEDHPRATITADLTAADHVPSDTFDCIIITQTLQFIYDVHVALATLQRILKPGGILLLTVPGLSQTGDARWRDSWFWLFTSASLKRLAGEVFPPGSYEVATHGNVFAATAFLYGLASRELTAGELAATDPDYPVILGLRAVKPLGPGA